VCVKPANGVLSILKKFIIVLIILVVALVTLFSPELKGFYYSYQTKAELNKIVADNTEVVCKSGLCTVEIGSKGGRFRFVFSNIEELSAYVSVLNKGLQSWPSDDYFCTERSVENGYDWCVM
jgi:hypothetical protein